MFFAPSMIAILWDIDLFHFKGAIQLFDTSRFKTVLYKEIDGLVEDIFLFEHQNGIAYLAFIMKEKL
jgi:hypothetical protein